MLQNGTLLPDDGIISQRILFTFMVIATLDCPETHPLYAIPCDCLPLCKFISGSLLFGLNVPPDSDRCC